MRGSRLPARGSSGDMPLWRALAVSLYYHVTLPYRKAWLRKAAARGQAPAVVLYYHRVADDQATPWTLSTRTFLRQVEWLRRRCELVSLEEVHRRMAAGANRRLCVAITFDDGYAANCRVAIPWLIEHAVPCTYFVTLGPVLSGQPFEHDVHWGKALEPNTPEELRAMAAAGIDIGSHTYSHPDLGQTRRPQDIHREVVAVRAELERLVGRPVGHFAFPFGQPEHLSRPAMAAARQAGYLTACSAYGEYNFPDGDGFHIRRMPADASLVRLKNWVTIDPRKLARIADVWNVPPQKQPKAAGPAQGAGAAWAWPTETPPLPGIPTV